MESNNKKNSIFSILMKYANEHSISSIAILDKNLNYLWVNQKFLDEHNYIDREIIGKNHYEQFPNLPEKWKSIHKRALNGETLSAEDNLYTDPLGNNLWIRWKCMPWYEESGSIGGILIYTENVSYRKNIELKFNELNTRYNAILSSVPDIIMEVNKDKAYTWANKAGYDFFGKDVIGKGASFYFAGEQDTYVKAQPIFNGQVEFAYMESWQFRQDGEKRLLAWWSKGVKGKDGDVTGAISTARDITEVRNLEIQHKQEEALTETLLRINQYQAENNDEFINYCLEEVLKLTNSKFSFFSFFDDNLQQFTLNPWFKTLTTEDYNTKNITFSIHDMNGIWGEAVKQRKALIINDCSISKLLAGAMPKTLIAPKNFLSIPVFRNSEIVAVAGVANKTENYDIDNIKQLELIMNDVWKVLERKQSEEKIQNLLLEKDIVLKEVHHRIKNNMATIQSLLSIQSDLNSNKITKLALLDASSRVKSMGILYDKLYRGEYDGSLALNDYLPRLVSEVTAMFSGSEKVKFRFDIEENIKLSPRQLTPLGLIINELSTNTMKYAFTARDQGQISLYAKQNNGTLSLGFEDDGVGLPENLNTDAPNSFGMVLISSLVSQLKGTSRWGRPAGNRGTGFYMSFIPGSE